MTGRIARDHPPVASAPGRFRFPEFTRQRLSNGTVVFVARRQQTPLVTVQLYFPAGGQFDPRARPGLGSFTAALLDAGTRRRGAMELAEAIEQLGGELATGAGWNFAYATVEMLGKDLAEGLDVLCEVSTVPTFPEEEIERQRGRRLAELQRRTQDPAASAMDALLQAVYSDEAYGHPLIGTRECLSGLGQDDVVEFYRHHFSGRGSFAIVAGDLDVEAAVPLLEERLQALPATHATPRPEIQPRRVEGVEIYIVDRPQAAQTELRIGHAGVPRVHRDRPSIRLLNAILGGKFTSRINLNLRERHGYTYSAYSRFEERLGPGPFVVSAAVANDVAGNAAREALAELERIHQERVGQEELDEARSYLLGVFPYTLQTLHGLSSRLYEIAGYGLPNDYFEAYPEALRAVTRDDLLRVAGEHLRPKELVLVAVGPEAELRPQLEELGEVKDPKRDSSVPE